MFFVLLVVAAFAVPAYTMRADPIPLTRYGIERARLDSLVDETQQSLRTINDSTAVAEPPL